MERELECLEKKTPTSDQFCQVLALSPRRSKKIILPLYAPEDLTRISAVDAATAYLQHLREAWDESHLQELVSDQQVTITVPASFDAVARELTLQAATAAGFSTITLLEEPISAFYAWLAEKGENWREQVSIGDLILVCDIGGGTTDFSLILVRQEEGSLQLDRIAVGDHILLGGDNMDLTLRSDPATKNAGGRASITAMAVFWFGTFMAQGKRTTAAGC